MKTFILPRRREWLRTGISTSIYWSSVCAMLLLLLLGGCRSGESPESTESLDGAAEESLSLQAELDFPETPAGDDSDRELSPATGSPELSRSDSSQSETGRIPGRNLAVRAKDELAASLMGRLVEAMVDAGPAGAIEVCSQEAPAIAERIGIENGVRIGRTSFRVRNPQNVPPHWAKEWVEQRVESPQFQVLDTGATAALFPIRIQPTCLACHGQEIEPDVQQQLAKLYPDDEATGFSLDELRGWFWVEVPQEIPKLEH